MAEGIALCDVLGTRDLTLLSQDPHGKVFEIPESRMRGLIDAKSVTTGFSVTGSKPSTFSSLGGNTRALD